MFGRLALLLLALANAQAPIRENERKQKFSIEFLFVQDIPIQYNLEDAVRDSLGEAGIDVRAVPLDKDSWNAAVQSGNFHLAFTETWGPPYDPHSFTASFRVPDEASFKAQQGMEAPMDKARLDALIGEALITEDKEKRQEKWTSILTALHKQAIYLPLSSVTNMAVFNKQRIVPESFQFGQQQFDIPFHALQVRGSKTITVAPAAQTGLFADVGCMNPHTYRPNEFFANAMVYEGLVEYKDGKVQPALAESWELLDLPDGRQKITFTLRQGITFHDGEPWNAAAAKLNFDHVLHPALVDNDFHGWYDLPARIQDWEAEENYVFSITLDTPYYPALQELTYIRPLRMLSPKAMPSNGNTCHEGWGTPESGNKKAECHGLLEVAGTGPWIFKEKKTTKTKYNASLPNAMCSLEEDETIESVLFERNSNYWRGPPDAEFVKVVRYESHEKVADALVNGSLDFSYGSGPLTAEDFKLLRDEHRDTLESRLSAHPLNTRAIVINSNKAPTDSEQVRKAIIHAVNKPKILREELQGIELPANRMYPRDLPNCDIDLVPELAYDPEKSSILLDAAGWTVGGKSTVKSDGNGNGKISNEQLKWAIPVIIVCGLGFLVFAGFVVHMVRREKQGSPIFRPLLSQSVTGETMRAKLPDSGQVYAVPPEVALDSDEKDAKFSQV